MFSEKTKNITDACRFCWMCRHICPVGLVSGKEGNTPRGRALLLSLDTRDIKLTPDAYELMFQCALCNACSNDCATGYDPTVFTREARTEAIVNEHVPGAVKPVLYRAMAGNITGKAVNEEIVKAVRDLDEKSDILLYLGSSATREGAESALALIRILNKAGVKFSVLDDEPDSGAHLFDLMGHVEEVKNLARACINRISEAGAKTIVAIDPTYARFFKHQCGEWDLMGDIKVVTATAFVADLIAQGRLTVGKLDVTSATFHDPCRLARDLDETQPARDIIAAMGIELKEMFLNRKLTKCCGGVVLRESYGKLAADMAKARWAEADSTGARLLITACPACSENASAHVPENMVTADLFVLLDRACR